MNHETLTLQEVAEELRTSPHTLRWWRQQGTGPRSFKIGRRVMYRRSDIDAYLTSVYGDAAQVSQGRTGVLADR